MTKKQTRSDAVGIDALAAMLKISVFRTRQLIFYADREGLLSKSGTYKEGREVMYSREYTSKLLRLYNDGAFGTPRPRRTPGIGPGGGRMYVVRVTDPALVEAINAKHGDSRAVSEFCLKALTDSVADNLKKLKELEEEFEQKKARLLQK